MIALPIAPVAQPANSTWEEHRHCEWSWQIITDGPDRGVCPQHGAVFELPNADEAYEL